MEQAVPGMTLAWTPMGEKFIITVATAGGQIIFQFHLNKQEVKSLSAQIDQYLLQGNGRTLHLPDGGLHLA